MRNHWSCSKFADWLRGTAKPKSATREGWDDWENLAKTAHPIRYWIADTALDEIQNFINYPRDKLYNLKYYINNRWVTGTHRLTAHPQDIKPGQWCDVGNRFLPCLFNELVDYVEIERAWHHIVWLDKEDRKKYNPPWYATGWFHWRTWRSPQAGVDHLEWAAKLTVGEDWGVDPTHKDYNKPTPQAIAAQEILALYRWWKEVRPGRPDPHDASGWSELLEQRRKLRKDGDVLLQECTTAGRKATRKVLDRLRKIEAEYDKEDEAMMIRLIKIRQSLWT